jgi:tRNA threonylcarbamoyl adenosine modification protein YjeE
MTKAQVLRRWKVREDDLPQLAKEVKAILKSSGARPFSLWLKGDLGAGKTTFARELLRQFGVPDTVPVLSPTFTYMTEYETSEGLIAHMDLYRLVDGDEDSVEMLLSGRAFQGLIIEWPERALKSPFIQHTHELLICATDEDDLVRLIELT